MEHRKKSTSKPSSLPVDYLRMVCEVFTANFDEGLKIYGQFQAHPKFEAHGEIFSDEIVLAVSLVNEGQLAATTVYASTDFDPKASTPSAQELLSACVDAAGTVFSSLLTPDQPHIIEQLTSESLSSLDAVPFDWTELEADRKKIFVKLDKANVTLDTMADDWLKANDPDFKNFEAKIQKETEKLFFTGPKRKDPHDQGSGSLH